MVSVSVEAEGVRIVTVRFQGRWRGSGCRFSAVAIVAAAVSSSSTAVV